MKHLPTIIGMSCILFGCSGVPTQIPTAEMPVSKKKASQNLDEKAIVAKVHSIKRQGDHVLVIRKIPLTGSRIPVNVEYPDPDPKELRQQLFIVESLNQVQNEPAPRGLDGGGN